MFEIFSIAMKNIRRRLARHLLTITALAIFVLVFILVSSTTLTMQVTVSKSLSDLGGEIMVWDQGALVPFLSTIPENYTSKIENIDYVKTAAPQITAITTIDSHDWRITIGINPSDIPKLYTYEMIEGEMIHNNESQVVIGYSFADFIQKQVGENLTIVYSSNRQALPIVGVFRTDTWIDNAVIIPLKKAQEFFGMSGRTSVIIVVGTDPSKIDSVINEIRESIPNVDVFKSQEAATRIAPMLSAISWFSDILFTITGAACFFGITNVTLTGIMERTREIGIMKALGAKGTHVTRMIIYESVALGAFGGLLGALVSFGLLIQGILIPLTSSSAMPLFIFPEVFIYGLILSIAISIFAALYPIWKAVRVRPQEVLRFG